MSQSSDFRDIESGHEATYTGPPPAHDEACWFEFVTTAGAVSGPPKWMRPSLALTLNSALKTGAWCPSFGDGEEPI